MSFSFRDETRDLNDLTRKEANGSFIQLPHGITHYELSNSEERETVVLVHGFSVPYFIYDPTFAFLTRSGFRVLRYDLFGRGFSDRPQISYNIDLFVRQLSDLLDALRLTQPVALVGLSTGGPIAAAFTVRVPERVDRLVLIGPVGAKPLPYIRLLKLAATPGIGELLLNSITSNDTNPNIATRFFRREVGDALRPQYLVQMQYKGFRRAILSTIRNRMLDPVVELYKHIGKMDKPVLLFWGRQDHTVPFDHSDVLREVIPQLEFRAIENSGHIPHYDHPEEVNPILLKFLQA